MSIGAWLGFIFGVLGPAALLAACVFEFLARRMSRDPRCDKDLLSKRQQYADIGLVAAWILLAAAYLCFQYMAPDASGLADRFQSWMTGCIVALVLLDIVYLYLRRSRPRERGKKKRFWEI